MAAITPNLRALPQLLRSDRIKVRGGSGGVAPRPNRQFPYRRFKSLIDRIVSLFDRINSQFARLGNCLEILVASNTLRRRTPPATGSEGDFRSFFPSIREGLSRCGGRVETLTGAPLAYGKPGFKNDGFLAWGRRP